MRAKYIGNKADAFIHVIKSQEATAVIPLGAPVILQLNSTSDSVGDGVDVVLPSTAGAINYGLAYGVNLTYQLAAGQYGEAMVYGFTPSVLVKLSTRATTTDSWASVQSVASGLPLSPDFTNNVWQTGAVVAAASNIPCLLLDTIASIASAASNVGTSFSLVSTGMKRAFVRML